MTERITPSGSPQDHSDSSDGSDQAFRFSGFDPAGAMTDIPNRYVDEVMPRLSDDQMWVTLFLIRLATPDGVVDPAPTLDEFERGIPETDRRGAIPPPRIRRDRVRTVLAELEALGWLESEREDGTPVRHRMMFYPVVAESER